MVMGRGPFDGRPTAAAGSFCFYSSYPRTVNARPRFMVIGGDGGGNLARSDLGNRSHFLFSLRPARRLTLPNPFPFFLLSPHRRFSLSFLLSYFRRVRRAGESSETIEGVQQARLIRILLSRGRREGKKAGKGGIWRYSSGF